MKHGRPHQTDIQTAHAGSVTLEALFSVVFGVFFITSFVNLVNYVVASNAVEQAARVVSRCVTPTDPECVSLTSSGNSAPVGWYGERRIASQDTEVLLPLYNYNASMTRQEWRASYNTYRVHYVRPQVSYQAVELPLLQFTAQLNEWQLSDALVYKRIRGIQPGSLLRPRFVNSDGRSFPRFDRDAETSLRDRQEGAWWDAGQVGTFDGLPFSSANWSSRRVRTTLRDGEWRGLSGVGPTKITENGVINYRSAWIKVPQLSAGAECDPSAHCAQSMEFAGADSSSKRDFPWQQYARVAIKVFGEVQGSGAIKWGDEADAALEKSDGLVISTRGKSGDRHSRLLGGRNWEDADGPVHLVLRGPKGSHGAGTKPPQPDDYNTDILVERGGEFRIELNISVRNGPVTVNPSAWYYFDDYTTAGGIEHLSEGPCRTRVAMSADGAAVTCPDDDDCELNNGAAKSGFVYQDPICSEIPGSRRNTPSCHRLPGAIPVDPESRVIEQTACSENEEIDIAEFGDLGGQLVCGVTKSVIGTVDAGEESSCGVLPKRKSFTCQGENVFEPSGSYGPISNCVGLAAHLRRADRENAFGGSLANRIVPLGIENATWSGFVELSPAKWLEQWLPPIAADGTALSDPSVVERLTNDTTTSAVTYKRTTPWRPDKSQFAIKELSSVGGTTIPAPAEWFDKEFKIADLPSEYEVKISGVYPFDGDETPAIPYWGWAEGDPADYDLDCNLEQNCGGPFAQFASEELALRQRAATVVPEAGDLQYHFSYSAEFTRMLRFPSVEAYTKYKQENGTVVTECTPTQTICKTGVDLTKNVYLGEFSAELFPSGPPACSGTTPQYLNCYPDHSKLVDLPPAAITTTIDSAQLNQLGLSEINRLVFQKAQLCPPEQAEAGCAKIAVNNELSPEHTEVVVSYNLPLSPPISTLFDRHWVTVQHVKREQKEL